MIEALCVMKVHVYHLTSGNRNFKLFDDNGGLIWHKGYLDPCSYIYVKQFVIKYSEHMLISKFIYIHAAFIGITPLARV